MRKTIINLPVSQTQKEEDRNREVQKVVTQLCAVVEKVNSAQESQFPNAPGLHLEIVRVNINFTSGSNDIHYVVVVKIDDSEDYKVEVGFTTNGWLVSWRNPSMPMGYFGGDGTDLRSQWGFQLMKLAFVLGLLPAHIAHSKEEAATKLNKEANQLMALADSFLPFAR